MDLKVLDRIVNETVQVIENSKEQILEIADNAQTEVERVRLELQEVAQDTQKIIKEVDSLAGLDRKARLRLMEVSRNFSQYTEEDIKVSYENAQTVQIKLVKLREQEKTLRFRRDHLERSLKRLENTRKRAEALVSQVGVVLNYLRGDLVDLSGRLGEVMQFQRMRFHIIEAMEEERRRIAREIHDGPAQSMANLVLRTEFCSRLFDRDPEKIPDELSMLQGLVRASLKDIRKIIFDLRPMVLDDLGLVPAVKKYIEQFRGQHNLNIDLVEFGNVDRLPRVLEVALFRIIQECLNNVAKHAQAGNVVVQIELMEHRINLLIRDDGCGFNVDETLEDSKGERYGLVGMRERVMLLEGEIKITSNPGEGTSVSVTAPVNE
ncbi:MAG: sensor histidine kinase [Clostridia bacterium]|jgi:two-component system sensor histidine kinase DegS|nr:sensor histidine kinase [Clostridia bacterium]MDQ7790636.1 sensor histidine kinase [Clostridia bacterium]